MTQDWKTIVLMALNGTGVNESEALMQIRAIEPMMQKYLKEQRLAVLEEVLREVMDLEYCSKCCSSKEYCPDWGTWDSAVPTEEVSTIINQLKVK